MNSSTKENAPEKQGPGHSLKEKIQQTRSNVLDAMDTQMHAARRAVRKRKMEAEDLLDGATMRIRHRPLQSLGLALATGALIGAAVMKLVSGSRNHVEPGTRPVRFRV